MKLSPVTLGAWLALSVSACAHTGPGETSPASASVTPGALTVILRPAMNGTCSITVGADVYAFTYVRGRLTRSTAPSEGIETTYTYQDERLVGVERRREGELGLRQAFQYDASGYLTTVVTHGPWFDDPTVREINRRTFAYEGHRLVRVSDAALGGAEAWNEFVLDYDDQQRLASNSYRRGWSEAGRGRMTYHYDAAGRLSEVRTVEQTSRTHYDASGLAELVEVVRATGEVARQTTTVRDATGRAIERHTTFLDDPPSAELFHYEGTFDAAAVCGSAPPPPPGVPEGETYLWFDITT
jgi:YD repeat-containing protein